MNIRQKLVAQRHEVYEAIDDLIDASSELDYAAKQKEFETDLEPELRETIVAMHIKLKEYIEASQKFYQYLNTHQ